MLSIKGLETGYGLVQILFGIDLDVGAGEIVALLGSNGAGKSTLNNTISGLTKPWAGKVIFDGVDLTGAASETVVGRGLIHVPEGRRIFPNLSILENLELGAYRRGRKAAADTLERVFGIFPRLRERMKQYAGTLSGGEQQMLAIGRGMMAEPRLLILDEPSLGLSPLLVEELFNLITMLNQDGLAILLVEQNVVQSLKIASRAYVLDNGRISLSGPAQQLANDEQLRRAYLGM